MPFKTIAKIEVPKSYNNGQISCSDKYFNISNSQKTIRYISMKYVFVNDNHKGRGFSYRMVNSLLSVLNEDTQGIITNFDKRNKNIFEGRE